MKLDEIIKIEELYLLKSDSFNYPKYELKLIEGLRKDTYWSALSYQEKLDLRIKELRKKKALKEIYTELIILYEESVIELIDLIVRFLESVNLDFINDENILEADFLLYRLKNMLYVELFAVNKRPKLQFCGHVLFEEVVEPLLIKLKNTELYEKYKLEDIQKTYKHVSDLYKQEPYKVS